jgi:hypothetical protein
MKTNSMLQNPGEDTARSLVLAAKLERHKMRLLRNTLDSSECAGEYSYDANGIPETMATPMERAATLFRALDRRNLGVLTKQEFMEGYMQR